MLLPPFYFPFIPFLPLSPPSYSPPSLHLLYGLALPFFFHTGHGKRKEDFGSHDEGISITSLAQFPFDVSFFNHLLLRDVPPMHSRIFFSFGLGELGGMHIGR